MDKANHCGESARRAPGLIQKAATLAAQEVTADELKAINKLSLEPLTAEEVFTV